MLHGLEVTVEDEENVGRGGGFLGVLWDQVFVEAWGEAEGEGGERLALESAAD